MLFPAAAAVILWNDMKTENTKQAGYLHWKKLAK